MRPPSATSATSPSDSASSLAQWLAWLETLSPNEIDLGLERVSEVLQRLSLQQPQRVLHIAGTNGKGSCAAMLEAMYLQSTTSVGCYTSPHIIRYNERVRVSGSAVSDAQIVRAFERVETVRQGVPLTYFEFGTLGALCVFDEASVSHSILEIGLGGRLDAVNAVAADGALITNIALDHCDWLGDDVESIGREKAGIMRSGKPCIFAEKDVPASVVTQAQATSAELHVIGTDFRFKQSSAQAWDFFGAAVTLNSLARPALAGDQQLQNAAACLALLESVGDLTDLSTDEINSALAGVSLPGRFQRISRKRMWILDVAHNPHAAQVLASNLQAYFPGSKATCVFGALQDKDVVGMVEKLVPHIGQWIAVEAAGPRSIPSLSAAQIIANQTGSPCRVAPSFVDALELAQNADLVSPILVTGSFLTVGPALEWLAQNAN